MKIEISCTDLRSALQAIAPALNSTAKVLPLSDSFIFEFDCGGYDVKISAFNGEVSMTTLLAVEHERFEPIAVLAAPLLELLATMQPQSISLDFTDTVVIIGARSGKYKIGSESAEHVLDMFAGVIDPAFMLNSSDLAAGIASTFPFVGTDELRPAMTCISIERAGGVLTFAATNAHQLSAKELPIAGEDFALLLPRALAVILAKLPLNEPVEISISERRASFVCGYLTISGRLVDGVFPIWRSIVPKDLPNSLRFVAGDLLGALKRLSIFADKSDRRVIFDCGDTVTLYAQSTDLNTSAVEVLPSDYAGEPLKIAFNGEYLLNAIKLHGNSETVELSLGAAKSAASLRVCDGANDVLVVLMPLFIND